MALGALEADPKKDLSDVLQLLFALVNGTEPGHSGAVADLAAGGEVQVDAPGAGDSGDSDDELRIEITAKGQEPKALPASAD